MRLPRRPLMIALVAAGAAAFLVTIAFVLRTDLAETIIRWQLARKDVQGEVHVTRLGLHELELRDVAIAHLRIGRLSLRYDPWELTRGLFQAAEVEGLVMTLDFTGEGPVLGDLERLIPEPGGESVWVRLPALTLRQARINALLPQGPLPVNLAADITPGPDDSAALELAFGGLSERLRISGEALARFDGLVPVSGTLNADFAHRLENLTFSLRAETGSLTAERPETMFSLSGSGALATLATELPWPEAWPPEAGTFRLAAEGKAVFPLKAEALAELVADANVDLTLTDMTIAADAAPEWLRDSDGTLTARLAFEGRTLQGALAADLGNARSRLKANIPDGQFTLDEDYALQTVALKDFSGLATNFRTSFGVFSEIDLKGSLAGPVTTPTGPLVLRAASPSLAMNDFIAQGVALNADMTLVPEGDGFRLALSAPGRLNVRTLRIPTLLPLQRLDTRIISARLDLDSTEAGWALDQTLELQLPVLALRIARQDAGPLPVDLRTRPLTLRFVTQPAKPARVEVQTTIESLVAPEAHMALRGSRLVVAGDPAGVLETDLTGGTVVHQTEKPLFVPLTPRLHGTRRGGNLVLSGDLKGAGGGITVDATGAHDLTAGSGRLHFQLREIVFGRGGTEGENISPLLGDIEALQGRVRGEAEMAWRADGFDTKGVLALQNLSFLRAGMEIEGVDLTLNLDHLVPAHSLPHQQLKIRRLGAGVDVTGIDLRFQLDTTRDGVLRLVTEMLAMETLGGRLTAEERHIDPTTGAADLKLNVGGLNLATLIEQIGFEDLRAEGRIAGVLPVRVADGAVAITGAELRAEGPGRIRFRSPDTRQSLASGGNAVKLMLDALEDFQYDTLRITMDKPLQGDTKIVLQLNGNNPAVLDGQVFHLNIVLTGNAEPLLAALAEGRRLRNELMQPLFRLQPSPAPAAAPAR